jgi:hypothetical protein
VTKKLKIVLITLGIVVLGGGLFAYFYLRSLKQPSSEALKAIPSGAFCVISTTDARNTWEQLNQGNLIWAALTETEWAAKAAENASLIDSLLASNADMNELIADNPCYLSLHCTGTDGFNYVFSVSLPGTAYEDKALGFVKQSATGFTVTESEMTNAKILTAKSDGKTFYASVSQGVLQLSDNEDLLKTGIEQLADKGKTLIDDAAFMAVHKTAGEKSSANVYVNYSRLLVLLKRISAKSFHESLDALNSFAGWTETDLTLRPNAALLNGYTFASDSMAAYLNVFRGQQATPLEADAILPNGTVYYMDFCISNFDTYLSNYDNYLAKLGAADERRDRLAQLNTNYGYDPSEHIGTWIGNEIVKAEVNIPGRGITPVAILSTVSTAKAREKLESLRPMRDTGTVQPLFDSTGVIVRSVPVPEMLPATFGSLFSEFRESYYAITSHYVIFAEDENTLKAFVTSAEYGRTLKKDRGYLDFASNMATEASVTIYAAVLKTQPVIEERSETGFKADISHHSDLLKRFDGIVLQYNIADGDLHYTNAFLRHNPQTKKSDATLWELQLDTTFSGKPWLLTNHNTKGLDIFLQDDANKIYLISSTGTTFWKMQLNQPIMSNIQQIDALKNGKLQIVFNTRDSLYVLDRNGNPVAPFPIRLTSPATNGVCVMDYDNNREYRMLIACEDHKIYNYTAKGTKVEGWKYPVTDHSVFAPILHTVVSTKDYVVIADVEGRTYIVDRQGGTRLTLKEQLGAPVKSFFLEQGKDLARTRIVSCDSMGNVYRITFTDELERLHFSDFSSQPFFDYRDLNGDGNFEYVFLSSEKLSVYNQDKLNAFSFGFESPAICCANLFRFGDNDLRIGVTCPQASELHLINRGGADSEGFPLAGQTQFAIGQLNGENEYTLISGINGKYLIAYTLQ